jgi:alanine dehydrogenase
MSIIAGRIAVQIGTTLLHQPAGGKGKLLGGLPATERGKGLVSEQARRAATRQNWLQPAARTSSCSKNARIACAK